MQYDNISEVYDKFNDDFDYEKYLNAVFRRFALRKEGLVLDCGCGTGVLMEKLTDLGYDCTGVDASENMLENARERFEKAGKQAHLVCQELEDIDMYGAYDIVFCTLDTVNHILSLRGLRTFFKSLFNFTEPVLFSISRQKRRLRLQPCRMSAKKTAICLLYADSSTERTHGTT